MAKLSPIERAKLKKIFADPVLWAKAFVRTYDAGTKKHGPWTARSYQEEMLRDFSLRKVYRLGRRCVPGWAVIFDPTTGELITAEELFERKMSFNVVSLNSEYRATAKQNSVINESGEREVLRVTLESGKVIDATADHPLLTAFGWRNIEELNVGDSIGTPLALNFFGNQEIDDNDAKFLAYMIGDGNCTRKTIRFTQAPGKQLEEMKQIVSQYGCELHHYECSENPYDYSIRKKEHRLNKTYKNGARELLIKYDVFGHGADDKFIPKEIFRSSKRQIALFISRLFSTDGWACSSDKKTRTEIGYCSNSERLIRELAHLLLRFGIRTHIRKKKKAWILCICDRISFMIFKEEIGIYGKEEAVSKCFDIITQGKEQDLFMPKEINPVIQKEISRRGLKLTNLVKLWSSDPLNERLRLKSYKLQKWKARILSKYLGLREIVKLCDGDIEWDPVKSIEHLGKFMTYSVMVPENNNFVVNDVYTHNCGKSETMIIEGLWRAMTAPKGRNYRVLYVTPYENQVNLLFMRMRELIAESPLLKNEITRIKSSPYTVEFKNGSTILGFTTGASSGQGAASVRGQRADWLFLDEIDYMGENDYSTVAMIAGERPDIGMTCSSTPTGKRGVFYQMCTDKRPNGMGYSEHYHPSMDNPNWSQQLEDQYRAELTASQYDHEILAIFGTEEAGVFDKNKLDEAMRQVYYTYAPLTETQKRNLNGQQPPIEIMYDEENLAPYNPFRCIGIDWDAYQAGSSLLVLDFDVHRKKFMVMKRIEVPRSEYSLDKAVQMTVKLNQIYRPSWIFCDRGYGEDSSRK